jgi:uroporphyrinogen-III synthase
VLRFTEEWDEGGWNAVSERFPTSSATGRIVVASPRAPKPFVETCRRIGAEHLLELPAAAVGPSTEIAAREAGLFVDTVGPGTGVGLAHHLNEIIDAPATFILVCGRERRPELSNTLAKAGHEVLPVVVYRMEPTPPRELPPLGPSLEAVVLTSPRAVELYLAGVGGLPLPCSHWALGPTTRDAAAALGVQCSIPQNPSFESLAEELCKI